MKSESAVLNALNRHFIHALLLLGKSGIAERDQACRLAALAWSELRQNHPREAEHLNGVLHALTQSTHPKTTTQGDTHVTSTIQS